jgi:hypothetical protein
MVPRVAEVESDSPLRRCTSDHFLPPRGLRVRTADSAVVGRRSVWTVRRIVRPNCNGNGDCSRVPTRPCGGRRVAARAARALIGGHDER